MLSGLTGHSPEGLTAQGWGLEAACIGARVWGLGLYHDRLGAKEVGGEAGRSLAMRTRSLRG